ncbi:hypothetical protein BURKHO8Y_110360 [Burkholderia sp. 8Y]|nr:hypothetical protein BURKHO8Y_110360 [Burkholderia sp. 8Y]
MNVRDKCTRFNRPNNQTNNIEKTKLSINPQYRGECQLTQSGTAWKHPRALRLLPPEYSR